MEETNKWDGGAEGDEIGGEGGWGFGGGGGSDEDEACRDRRLQAAVEAIGCQGLLFFLAWRVVAPPAPTSPQLKLPRKLKNTG